MYVQFKLCVNLQGYGAPYILTVSALRDAQCAGIVVNHAREHFTAITLCVTSRSVTEHAKIHVVHYTSHQDSDLFSLPFV